MKRSVFFLFGSIILGIMIGFLFTLNTYLVWSVVLTLFLLALWIHTRKNKKDITVILFALFCCLLICIGVLRGVSSRNKASVLEPLSGKQTTFVCEAFEDKAQSDANFLCVVYAYGDQEFTKTSPEKVRVSFLDATVEYGDVLILKGVLQKVKNFKTGTNGEFDYISYLKKDGVFFTLEKPELISKQEAKTTLFTSLMSIRRWFVSNITEVVPSPESLLLAGITIAGKGNLPQDVKTDFTRSGLIHIVVLSGYNIALVLGAIEILFWFLRRRMRFLVSLFVLFLFVIMAGASAPVLRSALMASIIILGSFTYIKVDQNKALFLAFCILVFINPWSLLFDASFMLSFLATYAVINVTPLFINKFNGEEGYIKKIVIETISVQFFVTPYILYEMGQLSLIAPLSNAVVLPLVSPLMFVGFASGFLGFIPLLGTLVGGIAYLLASLVIFIVHICSSIPFASVSFHIPLFVMVTIYIVLFVVMYKQKNIFKQKTE